MKFGSYHAQIRELVFELSTVPMGPGVRGEMLETLDEMLLAYGGSLPGSYEQYYVRWRSEYVDGLRPELLVCDDDDWGMP